MFYFMNVVRSFVNYEIIRELCDRMRFEVDCAKSHHRVISEGLLTRCFLDYLQSYVHSDFPCICLEPYITLLL